MSLQAQDQGPPALKTVAIYTGAGAVGGAILGAGYWLMDPLNPSVELKNTALAGFGIGAIVGIILGFNQLANDAILPSFQEEPPNEIGFQKNYKKTIQDPTLANLKTYSKNIIRVSLFHSKF